ncbi:hypothetical protein JOD17_001368 [Geomicrobium sediminis]|uniref:Uncharacterized protein n=1 Tax=Geomicrobium sediminis TaxID=1347788 RepID=A0ABS2PB19_9BACL|nr:hypothetical protein [Geomicrobium sediminis]
MMVPLSIVRTMRLANIIKANAKFIQATGYINTITSKKYLSY